MPGEGVGHFLIKDLSSQLEAHRAQCERVRRRQIVLETTTVVGVSSVNLTD